MARFSHEYIETEKIVIEAQQDAFHTVVAQSEELKTSLPKKHILYENYEKHGNNISRKNLHACFKHILFNMQTIFHR